MKNKGRPVLIVFGVVLLGTALVIGFALLSERKARFWSGETERMSPVLKLADLSDQSFFLAEDNYLPRFDSRQSSLIWKIGKPADGLLRVSFFEYPGKKKEVPPMRFVVSMSDVRGREKSLIKNTPRKKPSAIVKSHYLIKLSIPAGFEIKFAALPEAGGEWPAIDVGMTVPSLEMTSTARRPSNLLIISIDALRILSSQTMTPTSKDTRNSDSRSIGNFAGSPRY